MGLFSWIKGWFVDVAYDARAEGKGNGEKLWYAGTSQAALFTYRLFLVRFALNEIQDYCAPYIKEVGQKFDSTYVTIQGYYEELQNVKNKIDKITEGMGKVGEGLGNLKGLRLNNIADKLESMGADVRDLKGILNDLKGMQTKKNVNPSDIKERLNNAVEQAYATIEHPKSVPSIHFNVKEPFTDIFFDIFTMFLTGVWIWIAGVRNVKRR